MLKKTFRGYSYEELQYKKNKWLFNNFERGIFWVVIKEDVEPCLFFGNAKLIIEFV